MQNPPRGPREKGVGPRLYGLALPFQGPAPKKSPHKSLDYNVSYAPNFDVWDR